jgi:tetratricopeptide (TPR) repeat protein
MKFIVKIILLLFAVTSVNAQQNVLEFNKKIYECENKWITYPLEGKETSHLLGYVYIDRQAGFTFHIEKNFTVSKEGKFVPEAKQNVSRIIARISNFNRICAVIPTERLKELGISETPEFMKSYIKKDEAEDLVSRAYHYNHIGASFMAIPLLEKAQKINAKAKGLLFELAYAYNDNENYKKVIELLQVAIAENENDSLLYKEFIFALAKDGQLENAATSFVNMKKIKDAKFLDEAAYCIAQGYYVKKDPYKFEEWAKETMSLITTTDSPMLKYMDMMRKELKK